MMKTLTFLLLLLLGAYQTGRAGALYDITLNTTGLIGHPTGPFQLDFQLLDGDGVPNNTILLTRFQFGTGAPAGMGVGLGGAVGSLATGITLSDTDFLNAFSAGFDPGASLQFRLQTSSNFAGGTPDQFSFAILDQGGNFLPTSFFDVFVTFDIDSLTPTVLTGVSPLIGGPIVTPVAPSAVPEPSTWMLLGVGLAILCTSQMRRGQR